MARLKFPKVSRGALGYIKLHPTSAEYREALFIPTWYLWESFGARHRKSGNQEILNAYLENNNAVLYRHFNKYVFRINSNRWYETPVTGLSEADHRKMVLFFDKLKIEKQKKKAGA